MSLENHQLGHYRLLHLIGSGGMGEIYLADDLHMPRQVAIKVIRTENDPYNENNTSPEMERLFQREMKAIASLDHPHILPVFDYGTEKIDDIAFTYLVMPYQSEGSLLNWLRKRENGALLTPREATHILWQAADALQHAHEHSIVHQDIKPPNFLVRVRNSATNLPDLLLADFGIAKFIGVTSTSSQSVRGTPTYMAPEQWEGQPVPASDQYSLAIMVFQLLTGATPFRGSAGQVMHQHFTALPPAPSALNPALSSAVDAVLLCALAKRPAERFPSVLEFARALQQALFQGLSQPLSYPGVNMSAPSASTRLQPEATVIRGLAQPLSVPGENPFVAFAQSQLQSGAAASGEVSQPLSNPAEELSVSSTPTQSQVEAQGISGLAQPLSNPGINAPAPQSPTQFQADPTMIRGLSLPQSHSGGKLLATFAQSQLQSEAPTVGELAPTPFQANQPAPAPVHPPQRPPTLEPLYSAQANAEVMAASPFNPALAGASPPAAQPRPRFSGLQKVLLLILVALAILGSGGILFAHLSSHPSSSVTVAPTLVPGSQAATQTALQARGTAASAQGTAAVVHATATAVALDPYLSGKGKLMLSDPLSAAKYWKASTAGAWGGVCAFEKSAYHIAQHLGPNRTTHCFAEAGKLLGSNFIYAVQTKLISGNCGGLTFRQNIAKNEGYDFRICSDGTVELRVNLGKGYTRLYSGSPAALHHGYNQSNTLAVVANGGQLGLYINKQKIAAVSDSLLAQGAFGLYAYDIAKSTEVVFSNAKIWRI
ncbi:MAG TPA: protein kinase [Ktedonobacteraceae bacterium]|nr:protein kinase [Ktedonobacteraceae bacterium]